MLPIKILICHWELLRINKEESLVKMRAGGNAIFPGIAGSAITKTIDLYVGRTGLSTEEALKEGYEPVSKTIKSPTRAGYYRGRKKLWINVIVDKKSGLILGAEIVGGEGVKGRIDLISFCAYA